MSELINNRQQRRETLKQIIRDIHQDHDPRELKERFKQLISGVGASEIAKLEQELISEGLPEQEIKRLCDVHVSVFKEGLEHQVHPEGIPGHPVQTFKQENRALERVVQEVRPILEGLKSQAAAAGMLSEWREKHQALLQVERHYSRKENILFPYLEKHGITGPPAVMWGIHDDIRDELKKVSSFLERHDVSPGELAGFISRTALPVLTAMEEMIYKEENILFPMCLETLSEAEWGEILAQSDEIGYCLIQPERGWTSGAAAMARPAPDTGNLKFLTGLLGPEEIGLIFNHLPVDITFVGKDDKVKYFSASKDRIFPRTPAIIGRAVQNCHPPDSVHVVNKILDDFRAGRRDTADFWLSMGGKFVYIRYLALRSESGEYMGTLEVTQDISTIKDLHGEKRILDSIH